MSNQATHSDNQAEHAQDTQMHPGVRSHATNDAAFRAHVQRGIASAETGPSRDFTTIDAEIRRTLLAP